MQKKVRKCFVTFFTIICVDMMVPYFVTTGWTGKIAQAESEELFCGKTVCVTYKNAQKRMEVNEFVEMVLAARLAMGKQVEVLKAESIMIRTDIYRQLGDNTNVDSDMLGMEFLTQKQMKQLWKEQYEENYALVKDCVAATGSQVIMVDNQCIDAKYTAVSCGKTMPGIGMLGDKYAYLPAVDCPEDTKSENYATITTITKKEFIKKMEKIYAQAGINENEPLESVQIVSQNEYGYIIKLQVGNVIMTGNEFARIFALASPVFTLEKSDNKIKITTRGVGDGFGVSIYTAELLAAQGKSCEEILNTFYSGITISSQ